MTMYICIEGGEGSYKSTTVSALAQYYTELGLSVLTTKEPGTPHLPVTMKLRELMLSNEYTDELSVLSRELISQSIRSIHMKKLVQPALDSGTYDLIIQDRGVLSGIVYAMACGVNLEFLSDLYRGMLKDTPVMYDHVFTLQNKNNGLALAQSVKSEFKTGDAMESMGDKFHQTVNADFHDFTTDAQLLRDMDFPVFSNKFSLIDVTERSKTWIVQSIVEQLIQD